ncbi:MAG: nickel/cobalt transporter [Blastocatellia bacterium]
MRNFIFAVLILTVPIVIASAHPLGNFSVNQYSRIEVGKAEIKIRQVLDLAEIPTFQLKSEIDTDKDGVLSQTELDAFGQKITSGYIANLALSINSQQAEIRETAFSVKVETGAGNLETLKIIWDLFTPIKSSTEQNKVSFQNNNYAERLGWREIVVNRSSGVEVFDSTAYGSGVTDELKAYPEETLSSPLGERAAEFSFTRGSFPDGAKPLQNRDGHVTTAIQKDRLADLISVPEITPAVALFGLLLAFGLGALHAMSPGHGKAVVGAYLVGSKGTPKHAAFLGLTVTITHTLGVFALGLLTLFAANFILPETIMPFLSFFSGLIVLYIGLTMFKTRLLSALGNPRNEHHHHHGAHSHSHGDNSHSHEDHHHHHEHDNFTHTHDGHTHTHLPPEKVTWKNLLALGVSGGLLPCPSALVLMLSAISLGRVGYGLILTVAFSLGLAATLTVVGLAFLYVGKLFNGTKISRNPLVISLPVISAFVIACLGAMICYTAIS